MSHTLADFLSRAIVWPDPQSDEGWVNLHWRRQDGKGITGGQAFKTLDEILGFISWATGKGAAHVADLYYCTSLQKMHGPPKQNGRYSALRSADNAVASRLLFADVDKYATKHEAAAAIEEFCRVSGSPEPTAIVDSGGGLHAYWFLSEPLSKDAWFLVAVLFDGLLTQHGLKHDNISTDVARILRPPETFNYKRGEPTPVVLKLLNGDIQLTDWKSLHEASPTPAAILRPAKPQLIASNIYLNDEVANSGPARKALGKPIGIGLGTLDAKPVLQLCPMFRETLATGGEGVGQPVWHQQALACTFFIGGRNIFHNLGYKHAGYDKASSDEMFDRKLRDRERIGLGYPSCAAFEADGATQCRTCSLKGKIASPLNAQLPLLVAVAEKKEAVDLDAERPELPPDGECEYDYTYGEDGRIYFFDGKGKSRCTRLLFYSKIVRADIFREEQGEAVGLRIICSTKGGGPKEISIPGVAFSEVNTGAYKALNDGGCAVAGNAPVVNRLMLSFRGRLQEVAKAERNIPYGWEYADRMEGEAQGTPLGFSYGGKVYAPDHERKTVCTDLKLQDTYCVTGLPEPWLKAVKAIQSMGSPGHEAIVLCSFAAPLMVFSGHPSTVVMIRGDSGGGKSTVSAVAAAVWARPRTALLKPSSSKLGMMKRMGKIRHLPTIWDDIRTEQFETVKDTLMEITQGGDGLKLDMNRNEREQGIWDNMLITSSNDSLAEYLEAISKQNGASLVRCFEFEVPEIHQGEKAYLDFNIISPLIASLDHNHGYVGREYARLLGSNPAGLQEMYKSIADEFAALIHPYQPPERFWLAAAATITMAARLVNSMPCMEGARFDTEALEKFLVETYMEQRERLYGANIHAGKPAFVKHHLSSFINNWAAIKSEIIWTMDAPAGPGKPAKTSPIWPVGDQARAMKKISVRWITAERKVKISKSTFDAYLRQEGISPDRIKDGLVKHYSAKVTRGRIAAGVDQVAAQGVEPLYEIDVLPGSWLDQMLQQHTIQGAPPEIGRLPLEQTPDPQEPRQPDLLEGPKDD